MSREALNATSRCVKQTKRQLHLAALYLHYVADTLQTRPDVAQYFAEDPLPLFSTIKELWASVNAIDTSLGSFDDRVAQYVTANSEEGRTEHAAH